MFVVDCETSEVLDNVPNFGGHDKQVDETQTCFAIEIYDESLEGDDVYVVDEVDDVEIDEETNFGGDDIPVAGEIGVEVSERDEVPAN